MQQRKFFSKSHNRNRTNNDEEESNVTQCRNVSSSNQVLRSLSTRATSSYDHTVIIGDTAEAVLYAYRLVVKQGKSNVVLLCQGIDGLLNNPDVTHLDFALSYYGNKADYFSPIRTSYIKQVNSQGELDTSIQSECEFTFLPWGPLGSVIYQLILDIGPWFNTKTKGNVQNKINDQTIKSPYTTVETKVADYIKLTYNLQTSTSVIVKSPSVIYSHYYLCLEDNQNMNEIRNIFYDQYQDLILSTSNNFTFYPQVLNVQFSEGASSGYKLEFSSNTSDVILDNCDVIWKTIPQQFQQMAIQGGVQVLPTNMPVQYRAVIALPVAAAGLTGVDPLLDGTTSRVSFSLCDLNQPKNKPTIGWLVTAYTTNFDVVTGQSANTPTYTLLIVSAVSIGSHTRKVTFSPQSQELQVYYDDPVTEQIYFENFQEIVSSVYHGYTGSDPSSVPEFTTLTGSNKAQDVTTCTSKPTTMTEPYIIMSLAANLYGLWYYKPPSFPKI